MAAPARGGAVTNVWIVSVNDRMQQGYRYELSHPAGRNFDPAFQPELMPQEMLHWAYDSRIL
jgi:hypothetical protein